MKQKRKQEYMCEWCNKKYIAYPLQRRGKHKFCCMECRVAFVDANKINTHFPSKCDNRGKSIMLYQWELDHHEHHFCGSECQYKFYEGEGNPNFGKPHTQEAIDKISATKKKNYKKENHPLWGKHHSAESKEKMRIAHLDPSEETRAKMRANHPRIHGAAHYNWKGGASLLEFEEAYGIEMKDWYHLTKKVRERDSFTCQYCGTSPAIIVHHIIPRHDGINNSMNNLITLCPKCHGHIEAEISKLLDQGIDPISIFYEKWLA